MRALSSLANPITLDDLVTLVAMDESHRFELSAEGVLEITGQLSVEHQAILMQTVGWLLQHGWEPDQVLAHLGVHIGSAQPGGRQPDLSLWPIGHRHRKVQGEYVDPAGMIAAIEIVSPSSRTIDKSEKRQEYAAAGIPNYVIVDCDDEHTVTVLQLVDGGYEITTRGKLARLLAAYDPKEIFRGIDLSR